MSSPTPTTSIAAAIVCRLRVNLHPRAGSQERYKKSSNSTRWRPDRRPRSPRHPIAGGARRSGIHLPQRSLYNNPHLTAIREPRPGCRGTASPNRCRRYLARLPWTCLYRDHLRPTEVEAGQVPGSQHRSTMSAEDRVQESLTAVNIPSTPMDEQVAVTSPGPLLKPRATRSTDILHFPRGITDSSREMRESYLGAFQVLPEVNEATQKRKSWEGDDIRKAGLDGSRRILE